MRKYAFIVLLVLLSVVPLVRADVGIGIRWNTEWAEVNENSKACITYGLYNPFDTQVNGYLKATKDLEKLAETEDPKPVPAGTSSNHTIPTEICFNIPKVYEEDCLFLGMLCEKKCEEPKKAYDGEVLASYKSLSIGGMGSATGSSFAVPLRIEVKCNPYQRDFTPVYVLVLAVVIIALLALYFTRARKKVKRPVVEEQGKIFQKFERPVVEEDVKITLKAEAEPKKRKKKAKKAKPKRAARKVKKASKKPKK